MKPEENYNQFIKNFLKKLEQTEIEVKINTELIKNDIEPI